MESKARSEAAIKAAETRKKHEESRKAKEAERAEVRETLKNACMRVLKDRTANTRTLTMASIILFRITQREVADGTELL